MTSVLPDSSWLALMIGNSRLHWAFFIGEKLCYAWDTQHLPASVVQQLAQCQTLDDFPKELFPFNISTASPDPPLPLPLYLASVVPSQTALWQTYPQVHVITLDLVPLGGIYPTLGIDRALALWGAGETWGFPALVIDAGTAITLTGADPDNCLFGGAILPGVKLQLQSLAQRTANLPLVPTSATLPQRWALNTPEAIASGIFYTLLAGIKDFIEAWWQQFEGSCVVLTGGDRALLLQYLQAQFPTTAAGVIADPHLIFWGMRSCKRL
jgi:type III pantothenate kinase